MRQSRPAAEDADGKTAFTDTQGGSAASTPSPADIPEAGGWRLLRSLFATATARLDPTEEREFGQALDRSLDATLPAFGPAFGIGVLLFGAWDYWIAPQLAASAMLLRLALVLLGAVGYLRWRGRIPVAWRCGLVYVTHAAAMILSAGLLPDGLVLALPAITGIMFPLALVEPRLGRLAAMAVPPALLFLILGATVLPGKVFASSVLVYAAMLGLVAAVALFQGHLLRKEFLAERALTYTVRHDSLCGVLARGYLLELATHDIALARRYGHPLAIGMVDIDYFKRVNDTWGHAVGDALLRAVSEACSGALRASDYFGRIGGEEFVCVMPETDETEALACAERMRLAVAALRLETPQAVVRCTISIGVAQLDASHADIAALLAAADTALYCAKSKGRDRVELARCAPDPVRRESG